MLEKGVKNGLYKTLDARSKEDKLHMSPFMETGTTGSKNAKAKLTLTNSKLNTQTTAKARKGEPGGMVWHLATFSSPEQLAQFKEKQAQNAHEAMLRKELAKFRAEVEAKFRNSETNRIYTFPRNDDLEPELPPKTTAHIDFTVLPVSTGSSKHEPVVKTKREVPRRSKERSSDYFATCHFNKEPIKEKVQSRAASGSKKVQNSSSKIFAKIQTLVHHNAGSKRPPSEEHSKKTELSFNSVKGALLKTITLQTKTVSKEKPVSMQKPKLVTNASSSVDSRQLSGSNSERKLMQSSNLIRRVNDTRKQLAAKPATSQSKSRLSPASRIRNRINARFADKSKDNSSIDSNSGRKDTSGSVVRKTSPEKNPDYFVVQKTQHKKPTNSPGVAKDGKFSFNIKKILATVKGDQRASASNLKNAKATPIHSRPLTKAKQAASDGKPAGKGPVKPEISVNKSATKTRPMANLVPDFMHTIGLPKGR